MYLEMRKAQGLGPATPREIFESLKDGGYQFETKDETNAMIGLRALLRKNTVTFHKLPSGTYGMASWYPDAKKPKVTSDQSDADGDADDNDEVEVHAAGAAKAAAA